MKKLFKTEEVAQLLGVRQNTIEGWRCKGVGPAFVRVGRSIRYREEDIEIFLTANKAQNTCRAIGE